MDTSTKHNLGKAIRARRALCGYGKAEFAQVVGVSRITLRRIEAGEGNPTIDVLIKIADGLGMSFEELVAEGARISQTE